MQRAAVRDRHLLEAAADAEQRHAAFDAGVHQRERQLVAVAVVGLVARMRFEAETRGMDIGTSAGEQDAVDGIEQGIDIGDTRRAGKHQRQRARDLGDRAQVALSDHLGGPADCRRGARSR
jgi:hypothetical protein